MYSVNAGESRSGNQLEFLGSVGTEESHPESRHWLPTAERILDQNNGDEVASELSGVERWIMTGPATDQTDCHPQARAMV